MTLGAGGQFSVRWSNCGNFVCGKGWSTGAARTITWSGSSNGAQYVGVYGWMQNPLVEYYIPRSGGTNKGTYSADGTTYTLYTNQRVNQPSIEGTKTFTQYFCGGSNNRSVNFGQHMDGWRKLGMGVGSQNYQVVAVEGWGGSSGSADITVGGGTTTVTPTPTIAPTYAPTATPTTGPTIVPTSGSGCSGATGISVPFNKDGAGEFCWSTSNIGNYINSWNLSLLEVNGVNLTNRWVAASSLPAKQNGLYNIHYKGSYAWSHFEAR
jgi:endo-1,4-beta-xylanase